MSEAAEAEVVDTPPAEGEADATPQLSAEDRALTMGWTPKDQFKGDPERWVDAETFVKRGEEFLPFVKAHNKRLEQALDRANAKMAQMEKGLSTAIQQLSRADQRAYEKARAELEVELKTAASNGDVDGVKAATDEIVALDREVRAPKDEEVQQEDPDFVAWREKADWFGKDTALTAAFNELCVEAYRDGYASPKAGLQEAERRLREAFPEKFKAPANPNRNLPGAVEGATAPRRGGKTYADLPADAKAMCDSLIRDMPKTMTREKYVRDYFAQEK